jgi:hypothetical protein
LEDQFLESPEPWNRSGSWAFQLALCLLAPLFFLSYLFTVLSPFPSLYLHAGNPDRASGRFWWAVAMAVGAGMTFIIHGWMGGLGFVLLVSTPALVMGELLLARKGPEIAIAGAFVAVMVLLFLVFWAVNEAHGIHLGAAIEGARVQLEQMAKETAEYLLSQGKSDWAEPTKAAIEEIAKNPGLVLLDLPGLAASGILLLCVLPCLTLIRWNPNGFLRRAGIGRDFLRKWKSPDWLVWPAILCVTFLIIDENYVSSIARNCVKPLLLIYFFQGMSILAYFLDSLRLRGPFRIPIYFFGIVVLYPMMVSFGFFDLWLNFRNRKRPTEEESES